MRDLSNTPIEWMSLDELQAAWTMLQSELANQDGITLPQVERREHIKRRLAECEIDDPLEREDAERRAEDWPLVRGQDY